MAVFYHGTTGKQARPTDPTARIRTAGAVETGLVRPQSGRGRTRARRKSHGGERPLVLRCGIDIGALARNAESGHIFHSRGVLSVRGPVPASVLREETGDPRRHAVEFPHEPVGLARWINRLLELQPHKSAGRGIGVPTW